MVGISLTEGRGLPQLRSMWKPFASWWLGPRTQYNTTQHNENTCSKNITLHLKSKISQQIATKQMYLLGPNNCVSLFNPKLPPPVVAPQWSSRHPKHRSNVPVTSPATLAPSPGGKNITICGWKNKNRLETSGKMIFFCGDCCAYFLSKFAQFTSYEFRLVQVSSGFILAYSRWEKTPSWLQFESHFSLEYFINLKWRCRAYIQYIRALLSIT